MEKRFFTAEGPTYYEVKDHLFDQYAVPAYDDETGLSTETLEAGFEALLTQLRDLPPVTRKAKLFAYVLENARIDVDPVDWFADHFDHADHILYRLHERRRREQGETVLGEEAGILREAHRTGAFFAELDLGHISPGWRFLLEKGIPGILAETRDKLAACTDETAKTYYEAVISVYTATLRYMERLGLQARKMAKAYPEYADRMTRLSACLSALRTRAPQTLYEALQLAYIFHQLIEFEGEYVRSMGSFEWNFGRFYEADLAAGRITQEDARELIRYFWMKFFAWTRGSGNGKNFYFGGMRDENTVNIGPLSYLALELFYELNQTDPKLSIKLGAKTPEPFRRLIAKCLRDGRTNMVLVNDDESLNAIRERGVSEKDSYEYLLIGCYEPAIEGKEAACNMCVKFNLVKPVELALWNGVDPLTGDRIGPETGDCADFDSFEQFYNAYEIQLAHQLDLSQRAIRGYEKRWEVINPSPFLSATFPPCLEKGRDIGQSGPKYNNTGSMGGGLANAADSLTAIRQVLFE